MDVCICKLIFSVSAPPAEMPLLQLVDVSRETVLVAGVSSCWWNPDEAETEGETTDAAVWGRGSLLVVIVVPCCAANQSYRFGQQNLTAEMTC